MRVVVFGLCVFVTVAAMVATGSSHDPSAMAQTPESQTARPVLPARLPVAAAGNLMAFSSEVTEGPSQITLIDAESHSMCVYHIDRATGEIELKSVRNFRWDLLVEEFNGVEPLPRQLRELLQNK